MDKIEVPGTWFAAGALFGGLGIVILAKTAFGMPVWMAMIVSITLSSVLAIAVIGYLLVRALRSAGVDKMLSSQGLKTYME